MGISYWECCTIPQKKLQTWYDICTTLKGHITANEKQILHLQSLYKYVSYTHVFFNIN